MKKYKLPRYISSSSRVAPMSLHQEMKMTKWMGYHNETTKQHQLPHPIPSHLHYLPSPFSFFSPLPPFPSPLFNFHISILNITT